MNSKIYQKLSYFPGPNKVIKLNYIRLLLWKLFFSFLFRITPNIKIFFNNLRIVFLKICGAKIGKGVMIRSNVKIYFPWNIHIGEFSWIGDRVVLYSLDKIIIGNDVCISQESYLNTGTHDHKKPTFDLIIKPIIIEDQVWIGARCFINLGVRIGFGSVVGVCSNVIKDLPSGMICYGNPCRPVSPRVTEI